jgi:OOP family OmpA-OmpF porin
MPTNLKSGIALVFCVGLALAACKVKHTPSTPTTGPAEPASAGSAVDAVIPAPQTSNVTNKFDINSVPISNVALPPFPFLEWPRGLKPASGISKGQDFDREYVIVGRELRAVEGRTEVRRFDNEESKLSLIAAQRNYETAIKALGGVKVNTVRADDTGVQQASGIVSSDKWNDMLKLPHYLKEYDAYLLRTPQKTVWFVLSFADSWTQIVTVEEQAMQQAIGPMISADAMQTELAATGHVALYLNFDTDNAVIRPDAMPAIAEITKLLKKDPALQLSVQGHTDNSGNAWHNKALSQQRADAVVASLSAAGIDKGRLKAQGLGAEQPIADNGQEQGRARNRRVELVKM